MINIDFRPLIWPFIILCALAGWGVIELTLWLLSFIDISFR